MHELTCPDITLNQCLGERAGEERKRMGSNVLFVLQIQGAVARCRRPQTLAQQPQATSKTLRSSHDPAKTWPKSLLDALSSAASGGETLLWRGNTSLRGSRVRASARIWVGPAGWAAQGEGGWRAAGLLGWLGRRPGGRCHDRGAPWFFCSFFAKKNCEFANFFRKHNAVMTGLGGLSRHPVSTGCHDSLRGVS